MPWNTPTRVDLVTQTVAAFSAEMPGLDAGNRRNNVRPVAKIMASGLHDIHRFASWAADQKFVLTCDDETLDRHGAEMKPPVLRKQASRAAGVVTMTASGAATLLTGAILTRADGAQFSVLAGVTLAGAGASPVSVEAVLAGAVANTDAATILTASAGLTGPATFAVSSGALSGGAEVETHDRYRRRLLFAKAYPEHAGAPPDYVRYATDVAGVTRAFIDPLGAGRATVVVYPLFDETTPNGIGSESDRLRVQSALDAARPGGAFVVVRNPIAVPINVTITGIAPASPEVFTEVEYEIRAAFARQSRVAGWSSPHPSMPFLAKSESFSRSWIWQAAANATGEERHTVVAPASDLALTPGQMAVPGTFALS